MKRSPNDNPSRIVADGAQRLRDTPGYADLRARLLAEHTKRHEAELRSASRLRRLLIAAKIRHAVAAELRRRFPPGSLHLSAAPK